jgi:hypothetical protein
VCIYLVQRNGYIQDLPDFQTVRICHDRQDPKSLVPKGTFISGIDRTSHVHTVVVK